MDREKMLMIDEELDSSEVAALCFLCRDVLPWKHLTLVKDATDLFQRLEENGRMENSSFLCKLLATIRRADLLSKLETDSSQLEETDATPTLTDYRVMLYEIHEDTAKEDVDKMKFLMCPPLKRRQLDECKTALDVFVEMEKNGLLSSKKVDELHKLLLKQNRQLALTVERYAGGLNGQHQNSPPQRVRTQEFPPILETQPSYTRQHVYSDAQVTKDASPPPNQSVLISQEEYYTLSHIPRGVCFIINNEKFTGVELKNRGGTQEDAKSLKALFTRLGFQVIIHENLTAGQIQTELNKLGKTNFMEHDVLVVCVLSHGEYECVFGADEKAVPLRELTRPFTSKRAPSLAMKPKLFFIQACQGNKYQSGALPCPPTLNEEEGDKHGPIEEDAGPVHGETVPTDADFLIGMATVPECKSFRSIKTGSIFIQELCRQLERSAQSTEDDDVLSIMTRVNREVSRGVYRDHKQMPEPKYTLTKKLVLKFVNTK